MDHVRLQVGNLFESTEKTRNDAMEVLKARQEIVDTKQKLELLLREASVLGNKYDGLEKQRETIDTAQTKMDRVTTVLEDIEANLENLKEQRTVVDHVAEKVARLDFALQRAEAATRELREERALASRIYKGIQKERASGSSKAAPAKPSTPKPRVAKTPVTRQRSYSR